MRSTPPLTKISVSLRLFENEGRSGRHRFKKWPIPSSLGSAIAVAKWPKSAPDEAILSALLCLGRGVTDRKNSLSTLECCCWGLPGSFGLPARRRAYAIRYHAMAY